MQQTHTARGFDLINFEDRNGCKCSLQKSSLADEDCVWLGMDEPDIKEFYPYPRETDESWFEVTKEDLNKLKHRPQNEIHCFSRMELNREQVAELLPYLQRFVEIGEITE